MNLSYKILVISGINEKTFTGSIETDKDSTLSWLLNCISEKHNINLLQTDIYMAILDGAVINIPQKMDMNISAVKEFLAIPLIAGG